MFEASGVTPVNGEVLVTKRPTLRSLAPRWLAWKREQCGTTDVRAYKRHEGWLKKKSLSSTSSNSAIEDFYNAGLKEGAGGGKIAPLVVQMNWPSITSIPVKPE